MQLATSLRWALYYRGLALASFLVGAAVAAVGVWVGLYDVFAYLLSMSSTNGSFSDALAASRPLAGGALVLLGLAVWQIGKTAAFYKTLTEATEAEMADRFDTQTVKSEILAVLDDQLSDIHADVETTRRHVSRLGREEHADAFDMDVDGDESSGSAAASGGTTSDGTASNRSGAGSSETRTTSGGSGTASSGTGAGSSGSGTRSTGSGKSSDGSGSDAGRASRDDERTRDRASDSTSR